MSALSVRAKLGVFAALLIVMLGMAILFGSGTLRFGLEGPFVYIIYIVAGLVVAFACFGLLDSTGELTGKPLSTNVKLGGAIVGLVVVTAGGALYEIYARPAQTFATRFVFFDGSGQIVKPKGTVTLFIGSANPQVAVDSSGSALFQNIPTAWRNKPTQLALDSSEFQTAAAQHDSMVVLKPDDTIGVAVVRKPLFAPFDKASIDFSWKEAESVRLAANSDRDLTIRLIAIARSDLPLPLEPQGTLIFRREEKPIPIRSVKVDLGTETSDDVVILQPNQPTTIVVSGTLSPDLVRMAASGSLVVRVRAEYLKSGGHAAGGEFISPDFPFNKSTVTFDR